MQSNKMSLIESLTNTLSGTLLSFGVSQVFFYCQGFIDHYLIHNFVWNITPESNIIVTAVLTVVSVIRSYCIRRSFNKLREKNERSI